MVLLSRGLGLGVALFAILFAPALAFVIYPDAFSQPQAHLEPANRASPASPRTSISFSADDDDEDDDTPLPVVIWHGLGDSFDGSGLKETANLIADVHPGTYTYVVKLGADGSADRSASFFGNLTLQVEDVCEQLSSDPILSTAPAIDAIGFSQGGQFLRAYVERCNNPVVRNLITFGSQHNGIAEFQKCASSTDWLCQAARALARSGTVWSDFVQSRLVPAQYYRDPNQLDSYLEHSNFLADVNNERALKNARYKENLSKLDHLVMVLFAQDQTVIPKESAWFAEVNATTGEVTELRRRPIYTEDWIGLKSLDEKGGLVFETVDDKHMSFSEQDLRRLFQKYLGPLKDEGAGAESKFEL